MAPMKEQNEIIRNDHIQSQAKVLHISFLGNCMAVVLICSCMGAPKIQFRILRLWTIKKLMGLFCTC